jgi:uncharacterized protein YqeY
MGPSFINSLTIRPLPDICEESAPWLNGASHRQIRDHCLALFVRTSRRPGISTAYGDRKPLRRTANIPQTPAPEQPSMDLQTRLTEDMKAALKGGQKERLAVIRMLLSDVKNIDLAPKPTTAEQAVEAYGKKLRKSVEEYEKLGKKAEADKLRFEIAVVDEYLPKKALVEETEKLVDDFLSKNAFTQKQFGQAMGAFMKAHGGQVDPARANEILRRKLVGT